MSRILKVADQVCERVLIKNVVGGEEGSSSLIELQAGNRVPRGQNPMSIGRVFTMEKPLPSYVCFAS
ncbi:hypothetical protein CJ030_MR7G029146 [Morella rubra]|uniref:Uncharacterized protein n=1 Tax=Morella rubra TaxID=262757 RepID=A0A6A1V884_9ROSI|nr:hypothetical protein CJ030_MR7G029146 [Morella rubra]